MLYAQPFLSLWRGVESDVAMLIGVENGLIGFSSLNRGYNKCRSCPKAERTKRSFSMLSVISHEKYIINHQLTVILCNTLSSCF